MVIGWDGCCLLNILYSARLQSFGRTQPGYQIAAVGKHCVSTVCTYVAPKPTVPPYVDTRIKSTLLETLELGLVI